MNFRMLNFYTQYGFKISGGKMDFSPDICFSYLYRWLSDNIKDDYSGIVDIGINKDTEKYLGLRKNNICFLSRNEVNYYMRFLNSLSDNVSYKKFKLSMANSSDSFGVKIKLNKASLYECKTAPALVRMMYEYPFCVQLKLAFSIKKIKEFKHFDFGERLCLALNAIKLEGEGHTIYRQPAAIMNNANIQEIFRTKKSGNVEDFINKHGGDMSWNRICRYNNEKTLENAANGIIDDSLKRTLIKIYNETKR